MPHHPNRIETHNRIIFHFFFGEIGSQRYFQLNRQNTICESSPGESMYDLNQKTLHFASLEGCQIEVNISIFSN